MPDPQIALSSQLDTCAHELRHASEDVRNLLTYNDPEVLRKRPSKGDWSALECVLHLNLSNQAMLPGIRQAVDSAQTTSIGNKLLKMDIAGRFLAWSLEPPAIIKLKTSKLAEPVNTSNIDADSVLQEFERLHQQLLDLLQASAGKALDQQKMQSPFAKIHYNAYSAFRIVCAHDRRHLWQARKALSR